MGIIQIIFIFFLCVIICIILGGIQMSHIEDGINELKKEIEALEKKLDYDKRRAKNIGKS